MLTATIAVGVVCLLLGIGIGYLIGKSVPDKSVAQYALTGMFALLGLVVALYAVRDPNPFTIGLALFAIGTPIGAIVEDRVHG